ncbi:MAG TPA: AIM24 family protein [Candidatus Scybalocola faecipullorum]|nr:AIM24 family protein [Candidatus Scybalocola faecipullorum]
MQYEIKGGNFPVVICHLEAGESMVTERGSMSWMSPNMRMETSGGGSIGKAFGRLFAGEAIFQNIYTAMNGQGLIAFASSFPGSIMPVEITPGNDLIVQKTGFLASERSVELSVFLRKKFGSGLFGGEGFIMQRLSGYGMAFLEIDGAAIEYELQPGQQIIVDTGYVAAMSATCTMDIQSVPGMKNALFGGEGLFNTVITGPGKIILQTMPVSDVAKAIQPFIVTNTQS